MGGSGDLVQTLNFSEGPTSARAGDVIIINDYESIEKLQEGIPGFSVSHTHQHIFEIDQDPEVVKLNRSLKFLELGI